MDSSTMKSLLSPRGGASRLNTSRLGSSLLPTYKRTPTKLSTSGRSNQSAQVVCKSQNYVLETFGSSLPVLVTEALTFADRSLSVSMNVSDEGWAWFVCSRRLLIWQTRGGGSGGGGHHRVAQCRELVLPPSDLAHRAQLVAVYTTSGNQLPSCMAVSPEGTVRYWASIAHESGWTEASADLHGQECETLLCTPPHGCLVATTTATVVLVAAVRSTPASATAQLLCRPFSAPHGWLGGIGRRVSSLFFGSGPPATHILETKLVKMVVRSGGGKGDWEVLLLAGHSLQKWLLSTSEAAERLVYESDISRLTRDALLDAFGDSMSDDVDIAYLDMQPTESGMMLLVSACAAAQAIPHYALVSFSTEDSVPPTNVSGLSPLGDDSLPFLQWMRPENEHRLQLLLGQSPLIYNNKYIVTFSHSGGESDILDVPDADIFGAALCRRMPIFFSRQHGLLSVSTTDASPFDFIISHAADLTNVSDAVTEIDVEELNIQADSGPYLQIKTAFLKYVGKEMEQSKAHVLKVFLIDCEPAISLDEPLDHAVIKLSLSFIDDIPSGDPRWADTKANTSAMNISASASLQILNQLIQKQNVLSWYISFLKDIGLWNHGRDKTDCI